LLFKNELLINVNDDNHDHITVIINIVSNIISSIIIIIICISSSSFSPSISSANEPFSLVHFQLTLAPPLVVYTMHAVLLKGNYKNDAAQKLPRKRKMVNR